MKRRQRIRYVEAHTVGKGKAKKNGKESSPYFTASACLSLNAGFTLGALCVVLIAV